ncbi:Glutathione transport system permease protein GsiD [Actinomadura rubteroloni]|uniref:Glutathione transport system permease protein GsiD n=1 Tax=Actinomadura rubteroloni TaxID=1926885 RepID=A0A2P4UCM1_9ACTN|nr:ABC transporter permease [Actinomadura rubteroloni]POM22795.1 Glutathione transport system permease protein GsiD [Actinomadura rubteroloni]
MTGLVLAKAPRRGALTHGRGLAGLVLVGAVVLLGVLAPLVAPYAPQEQIPGANLLGASGAHLFGTDEVNRDVFSRVLYGVRIDLAICLVAVPCGALLGGLAGLLAGQAAPADVLAQRAFDVLLAFPPIILGIAIAAVTGPGVLPVVCVVVGAEVPLFGRLVRTAALEVRELPYVDAAETMGASRTWVLRKHVVPNILDAVIVQLALSASGAVFIDSAMNFIGIGVRPPTPSLGGVLAAAMGQLGANAFYAVGPLLVIVLLVLGFQLIAQALLAARRGGAR